MHTKYTYISHVSVKSCKAILSYVKDGKCNCKSTPQNTHTLNTLNTSLHIINPNLACLCKVNKTFFN